MKADMIAMALDKIGAEVGGPPGKMAASAALEAIEKNDIPEDLPPWTEVEPPVEPGAPFGEGSAPPDLEELTGLPQIAIEAVAEKFPFDTDEGGGNGPAFDFFI